MYNKSKLERVEYNLYLFFFLVPTIELIEQLTNQAIKLFKYTNISILSTLNIRDLRTKFKEQIIITRRSKRF